MHPFSRFVIAALLPAPFAHAAAVPVEIREGQLRRGNEPYFVKGAGGDSRLPELARIGGNSFRTWSHEDLLKQLAEAEKLGLTVCAGIWLEPECAWFSYRNPEHCERQLKRVREIVRQHKGAAALLCWGLGNESEGDGTNAAYWQQLEKLAQMVRKEDPAHPTFTAVAGLSAEKAAGLKAHTPSLHFVGINTYGALPALREHLTKLAWDRPWMVTEFGAQGFWERPKTSWGAPLEQTSSEKAAALRNAYRKTIRPEGGCLGSYVFLWGQKQEATATWFGLFTKAGERVAALDVLQELWNGPAITNRAPTVARLVAELPEAGVPPGGKFQVKMEATDPDGDVLTYRWEVLPETAKRDAEGREIPMEPIAASVPQATGAVPTIIAPQKAGNYRVFGFALDGKGNAGTANVPFQVK